MYPRCLTSVYASIDRVYTGTVAIWGGGLGLVTAVGRTEINSDVLVLFVYFNVMSRDTLFKVLMCVIKKTQKWQKILLRGSLCCLFFSIFDELWIGRRADVRLGLTEVNGAVARTGHQEALDHRNLCPQQALWFRPLVILLAFIFKHETSTQRVQRLIILVVEYSR